MPESERIESTLLVAPDLDERRFPLFRHAECHTKERGASKLESAPTGHPKTDIDRHNVHKRLLHRPNSAR